MNDELRPVAMLVEDANKKVWLMLPTVNRLLEIPDNDNIKTCIDLVLNTKKLLEIGEQQNGRRNH